MHPFPGSTILRQGGLTLVELLVATVIFSILAAIAYPAYQGQIREARRADGQSALLELAARQSRWFYGQGSYTADLTDLDYTVDDAGLAESAEGHYLLGVAPETVGCPLTSCYVLQATPQGEQAADGLLELTSAGARRRDRNQDGDTTDAGENKW